MQMPKGNLLKALLERLGMANGPKIPAGFSSKKMASRLGGDEAVGEKFFTGQTRPRSPEPQPTAPFESDIVPYYENVSNEIPMPQIVPSTAKRNAMLAAGGALAGLGGLGGYMLGRPSDEEEMMRRRFQ